MDCSSVYLYMAVAILKYENMAKFAPENSQNSKLGGSRFVSIKTLNIVKKACFDINVQTQKSLSRSRSSWKFCHFLTVCLDLGREVSGFCIFLVEISSNIKTFCKLGGLDLSRRGLDRDS